MEPERRQLSAAHLSPVVAAVVLVVPQAALAEQGAAVQVAEQTSTARQARPTLAAAVAVVDVHPELATVARAVLAWSLSVFQRLTLASQPAPGRVAQPVAAIRF